MSNPAISHVQIPVRDLEQAVSWYTQIFGCKQIGAFGTFASLAFDNGVNLFLWQTNDDTTANFTVNGEIWPVLGIEAADIEELASRVRASGVTAESGGPTEPDPEGRRFYKFDDPFGNRIVAHEEPKR